MTCRDSAVVAETRKIVNVPLDPVDKLWNLENYITAFAIAQGLAFAFALAKREIRLLSKVLDHIIAYAGTLFFTALYVVAIICCERAGVRHPMEADTRQIWHSVMGAQLWAVGLFTALVLLALTGHLRMTLMERLNKLDSNKQ